MQHSLPSDGEIKYSQNYNEMSRMYKNPALWFGRRCRCGVRCGSSDLGYGACPAGGRATRNVAAVRALTLCRENDTIPHRFTILVFQREAVEMLNKVLAGGAKLWVGIPAQLDQISNRSGTLRRNRWS
jgi:hypothetical protein